MMSIRFDNVSKAYDEPVLQEFSMKVRAGETKIILGGSGSGKSTILKLVLGLVKPDTGRVFVGDREITGLSETELEPVRKEIGMVFQEGALFDFLTVGQNVAYRLLEAEAPMEEIEEVVRRLLGFVGLERAIDKMPADLSGGMRRRVAIARALVGNPKVILYDEPTAGLDPITARTICDLMIKLRDLEGASSIFVTHDLETALNMAGEYAFKDESEEIRFLPEGDDFCLINTRFVILKEGRILFEGSDEEMRSSENPYIQEFLT